MTPQTMLSGCGRIHFHSAFESKQSSQISRGLFKLSTVKASVECKYSKEL